MLYSALPLPPCGSPPCFSHPRGSMCEYRWQRSVGVRTRGFPVCRSLESSLRHLLSAPLENRNTHIVIKKQMYASPTTPSRATGVCEINAHLKSWRRDNQTHPPAPRISMLMRKRGGPTKVGVYFATLRTSPPARSVANIEIWGAGGSSRYFYRWAFISQTAVAL